jgi:hypothetical protein
VDFLEVVGRRRFVLLAFISRSVAGRGKGTRMGVGRREGLVHLKYLYDLLDV